MLVKIPETRNPFTVTLNGVEYAYQAGKEVDVPDAIGELILSAVKATDQLVEPDEVVPPFGSGDCSGGGVTSWNDLTDKPFGEESPILYNGYPEYMWGYAKLPLVLREGISYSFSIIYEDHTATFCIANAEQDDIVGDVGITYIDPESKLTFRLYNNDDNLGCTFYPDGIMFREGQPAESPDGSYAYTSKYKIQIEFTDPTDAGVKTLDPKYLPADIGGKLPVYNASELDSDTLVAFAKEYKRFVEFRNDGTRTDLYIVNDYTLYHYDAGCSCCGSEEWQMTAGSGGSAYWNVNITEAQYNEIAEAWAAMVGTEV